MQAMELSPNGESVAVLWRRKQAIDVALYSRSSAARTFRREILERQFNPNPDFVWNSNGTLLLVAVADIDRCKPPGKNADIFALDANDGTAKYNFTFRLLASGTTIASDHQVLVVDLNCPRAFRERAPKLGVFDLSSGKLSRSIAAREGVHRTVSSSRDGAWFIAYTGSSQNRFDWGDWHHYDQVIDETFTVWNSKNYAEVVTSQNIPGLNHSDAHIARGA